MTDSNYVLVKVNITSVGKYKITSDTVNGFWFNDSAYVLTVGTQNIKLKAHGKPILPTTSTFTVTFNATTCMFSVAVSGSGTTVTDYFPTTVNSNWLYYNSDIADTVRYTVDNSTYSVGGHTYSVFFENYSGGGYLYRKDGAGNYYTYDYYDSTTSFVDYVFLKDNVANGTQWESPALATTYFATADSAKIRYTMVNNSTSLTVNGITFNNVIQVKQDYLYRNKSTGAYGSALALYWYYAQGVGRISTDYVVTPARNNEAIKSYKVY